MNVSDTVETMTGSGAVAGAAHVEWLGVLSLPVSLTRKGICFDRISLPMVGYSFAHKHPSGKVDQ